MVLGLIVHDITANISVPEKNTSAYPAKYVFYVMKLTIQMWLIV